MSAFIKKLNSTFRALIKRNPKRSIFIAFLILVSLLFIKRDYYFQNSTYSSVLFDQNGKLLCAKTASDEQWRFLPSDTIPQAFEHCILEFEDAYFYYHFGLNPVSLFRALWQNISSRKVVSGASTISMQVIRLARPPTSRTFWNKFYEIFLAFRLEVHYSKNEILSMYLAHAPFGGNVVGLRAAAWRYFSRPPERLSWAEYATLAVLPNAPALIHLGKNRDLLEAKRNRLLLKLHKEGYLSQENYQLSLLEKVPENPMDLPQEACHLLEHLQKKNKRISEFKSTIKEHAQIQSQAILDRYLERYAGNNIYNGAVLVADIETGHIVSYVGNSSLLQLAQHGQWNDMVQTERSTGSVLKPFLYALMLHEGQILPQSLVEDLPVYYNGYAPKNYNKGYDGVVSADRALSRSLNVPAVRMLKDYSYPKFHSSLQKLGMNSLHHGASHYGLSIILGGAEGTLYNLCGMYASMARSMIHHQSPSENHIRSLRAIPIDNPEKSAFKGKSMTVHPGAIWYMLEAMKNVHRPENQRGWQNFVSDNSIAWKTGTSFGYRDAWAIGLNGKYVVGVWIGNADGLGRNQLVGVKKAAPVMFEIFDMLPKESWFERPEAFLREAEVCLQSGFLATEHCPSAQKKKIPSTSLKIAGCPYHQTIHLSHNGRHRLNLDCASSSEITETSWFVLPPAASYYFSGKNPWYQPLPPLHPACQQTGSEIAMMSFIYPSDFTRVKIPTELDGTKGEVVFRVAHRRAEETLYWYIDKNYHGSSHVFHEKAFHLSKGTHQITLVDSQGEKITQSFLVVE